ncbi:MAG: type II secretion system protein N [Allosphingosinicella sp.]|uniref:type II secretion system protein N n=1 Tax=Allosphingosinicella sp. TaxID=2823234 RepID=UPI00393C0212
MPSAMGQGAGRLLRRLPRTTAFSLVELLLLTLLAYQCARLLWALVTPIGPVGDWKAASRIGPPATAALGDFDPFFRLSGAAGPAVVTSLDLKLYGVREDRASGRGSAIIGSADGAQSSYAVGDEIMPGVTLAAVGFDHVTISRGGVLEQIYLDQSPEAEVVATEPAAAPATDLAAPPAQAEAAPAPGGRPINFRPRQSGGRVTGILVAPGGDGSAFRAAGFQPGDVIVAVNGRRIESADQLRALGAGGELNILVERAGTAVPLRVRLDP